MQLELLPRSRSTRGWGWSDHLSAPGGVSTTTRPLPVLFAEIQKITGADPYTGKVGAEDKTGKTWRTASSPTTFELGFALTDAHIGNNGRWIRPEAHHPPRAATADSISTSRRASSQAPPGLRGEDERLLPGAHQGPEWCKPRCLRRRPVHRTRPRHEEVRRVRGTRVVKTVTCVEGEELVKNTYTDKRVISGDDAFMLYDTFGFPPT